ncbi:MAG: hypothetical protein ACR2OZ_07040 [Verrucomicrobiales bacterium]
MSAITDEIKRCHEEWALAKQAIADATDRHARRLEDVQAMLRRRDLSPTDRRRLQAEGRSLRRSLRALRGEPPPKTPERDPDVLALRDDVRSGIAFSRRARREIDAALVRSVEEPWRSELEDLRREFTRSIREWRALLRGFQWDREDFWDELD